MKKIIIAVVVIIILAIVGYVLFTTTNDRAEIDSPDIIVDTDDEMTDEDDNMVDENPASTIIGQSVQGRDITAYHYGTGDNEVLFVGGIHGGYSWNTALVAYELIDYLEANPSFVPEGVKVTVVPVLNPDGLNRTVGTPGRFTPGDVPASEAETVAGRFNGNNVDLNRNFDCDWKSVGTWQNKSVDGGSAPFSEPEAQAIRTYVETNDPAAVVVWYSSAGGVFASSCHNGVSTETRELTNIYADASGYKAFEEFDFYEITGDMVNWLAKIGTPGISVLLTNHSDTEWTKNRAGIEALLLHYATDAETDSAE